ncbi:MAG: type IV pilus modification protein PilV [Magnetococcales bacterium]|nr:type IV pilus modification protein PilV [Magnetococcales bacterium]
MNISSTQLPAGNTIQGFTLIEILIALVVLSTGLLGVGLMQAQAIKTTSDASQRSQAIWLASEILDGMRANPNDLANYAGVTVGYGQDAMDDPGPATTMYERTAKDLYDWQTKLYSVGSRTGLYHAVGIIEKNGSVYRATIRWQDDPNDEEDLHQVWVETEY